MCVLWWGGGHCAYECRCLQGPEEGAVSHGAALTGCCELSDVEVGPNSGPLEE